MAYRRVYDRLTAKKPQAALAAQLLLRIALPLPLLLLYRLNSL